MVYNPLRSRTGYYHNCIFFDRFLRMLDMDIVLRSLFQCIQCYILIANIQNYPFHRKNVFFLNTFIYFLWLTHSSFICNNQTYIFKFVHLSKFGMKITYLCKSEETHSTYIRHNTSQICIESKFLEFHLVNILYWQCNNIYIIYGRKHIFVKSNQFLLSIYCMI